MVMGPTHSASASAILLTASAFGALSWAGLGPGTSFAVLLLFVAVGTGAALAPDMDSHTSTVNSSFGVLGKGFYAIANGLSMTVYSLTKTKYDEDKSNGHRTLYHTLAFAILVGLIVSGLASLPGTTEIFGKEFTYGQVASIGILWFFMHLGIAGIFEKQVRKYRRKFGPYVLMAVSFVLTVGIAIALPENENYSWLGFAAGIGWAIHAMPGDAITKLGVPWLWPIKIRGKRWYDLTLPSALRIRAGGTFEKVVLLPFFTALTAIMLAYHIPGMDSVVSNVWGWITSLGN